MKISERTISLLKNFASINENVLIPASAPDEPSTIRTRNIGNNIFAEANVDENFPNEVRIYNLTQLLSVLGMFDDPEFEFGEKGLTISGGSSRVRYNYAEKKVLHYAEKSPKMPKAEVEGTITQAELKQVSEAARHLNLPNISIIGESGKIFIAATDISDPSANEFKRELQCDGPKVDFKVHFSVQNLLMIPADYSFKLCLKGISLFENDDLDVRYIIAMRVEKS